LLSDLYFYSQRLHKIVLLRKNKTFSKTKTFTSSSRTLKQKTSTKRQKLSSAFKPTFIGSMKTTQCKIGQVTVMSKIIIFKEAQVKTILTDERETNNQKDSVIESPRSGRDNHEFRLESPK
jgi:hypothetical protein